MVHRCCRLRRLLQCLVAVVSSDGGFHEGVGEERWGVEATGCSIMCGPPLSFVRPRRGPLVGFLKSPTPRSSLYTSRRMTLKFKPITVPTIPPHHETMNLPLYFVLLVPLGGQEVLETLTEPVVRLIGIKCTLSWNG